MGGETTVKVIAFRFWFCFTLCSLMVANACSSNAPITPTPGETIMTTIAPMLTATSGATRTREPTHTPESPKGEFQLKVGNDPLPSFVTFYPENLPASPGTYLLFEKDNELRYLSLDGAFQDKILSFDPPYDYQENENGMEDANLYFITEDAQSPSVIIYTFTSGRLSIWKTDLSGKLLSQYSVELPQKSDTQCARPWLSTMGKLLTGSCSSNEGSYPYLINLEQGTGKYFTTDVLCKYPRDERWSGDMILNDQTILTYCDKYRADTNVYTCFISSDNWQSTCGYTSLNEGIHSISPDGNKVARIDHISDAEMEKPTNTVRIAVESLDCVLDEMDCQDKVTYELPMYRWFKTHNIGYDLSTYWNPSGDALAWELTPLISVPYGVDTGQQTMGVIDLQQETKELPFTVVVGSLKGLSPDEKWLAYAGSTLSLISTENNKNQIVLIPASPSGKSTFDSFKGWWAIP
jgi:hypothetical protein